MACRHPLIIAALASALVAAPASAADLGGYDSAVNHYDDGSVYIDGYGGVEGRTDQPRHWRHGRHRASKRYAYRPNADLYDGDGLDQDYGPRRRVRDKVFQSLRYDLEDAGYSRVTYRTERRDAYGGRLFFLTACRKGVRYRMHVTEDCEIEFRRRAGFCGTAYY